MLTGILRVAKEGIFSGLNNLMAYTIFEDLFSQYFGLLEDEVLKILEYYEADFDMEIVRKWYNGYLFGNTQVYNPWGINMFANNKKIGSNWANVSDNREIIDIVKNAVMIGNFEIIKKLERLLLGKSVKEQVFMASNMLDLSKNREIWQLMLNSGYLTVEEKIGLDRYVLKMPNEEVRYFFKNTFLDEVIGTQSNFWNMIESLVENDIREYKYYLQKNNFKYSKLSRYKPG